MQQWDEYCERVGFASLAEPLNAISNFSFIIAAWAAWMLACEAHRHSYKPSEGSDCTRGLHRDREHVCISS